MARRLSAAMALLAALVLASGAGAVPLASGRPDPLGRFRSWEEAWAALSPYALSPKTSALCGSGPSAAASCGEAAIWDLWTKWKQKYKTNDKRYGNFRTNVIDIVRRLRTCPKTLIPNLNNLYMDWSAKELRNRTKLWVPTDPKDTIGPKNGRPQRAWDWRNLGKVTPAKNQGTCGACWAFAAAAAIESKVLIQFNKTYPSFAIDLSEQQLIDCANENVNSGYTSSGCNGGNLEDPLFFASRAALAKEDQYPYRDKAGTCSSTAQSSRSSVSDRVQLTGAGFKQLRPWSAAALRQAVQIAPVLVGLYLPEGSLYEFFFDGFWDKDNCKLPGGPPNAKDAAAKINHAVLVVGYDMDRDLRHNKPPRWIIKNSWGGEGEWGQSGFAEIEMLEDGPGTCYMYYYMVTPTELLQTKLDPIWETARTSVRLVNDKNRANTTAGRLEIRHNGRWGTVCDDGFTSAAAGVVCRQLGRGTHGTPVQGASFGEGAASSPVWLDEVGCRGSEARLEQCAHAGWGVTNCGHKEDVGVVCRTEQPVTARLADAITNAGRVFGRLEVLHLGSWKPACSSGADDRLATVVCKQLSLGISGTVAPASIVLGQGAGTARLQSISCLGTESKWEACRSAVFTNSGCDAKGSVAVSCAIPASTSVRLVGGGGSNNIRPVQGRLEVRLPNGTWSTVCDDGFSDVEASIACRQLGLSKAGYAVPSAAFGEGSGPILYDNVACTGSEATIQQCRRSPKVDCTHREDVGVVCGGNDPGVKPSVRLRLDGNLDGTDTSGRLMIQFSGVWGSICDDGFDGAAAKVACRQLGLSGTGIVAQSGTFKPASEIAPIWLANVKCSGTEASLAECKHLGFGVHNCHHSEDVGIYCVEAPTGCTATSCGTGRYCSAGGTCINCNTIGGGRCTACISDNQCTLCEAGWKGATCQQQACKALGASGCTATGATICCPGLGLTCGIPSGSTSGTCMKPPTLAAAPVKGVSAVTVNSVVTATVQLAAAPVASNNGGAPTHYWTALIVPGSTSPMYIMQTVAASAAVFQEGTTVLLSGAKLPARGLCGRTFRVMFAARNGAGYSALTTSSANYTMPACPRPSLQPVTCWGDNTGGQNMVPRGLSDIIQVAVGDGHTCALTANRTMACWGLNIYGQATVPKDLIRVAQISAGWYHTCALRKDTAVTCWGDNRFGQVADTDWVSIVQIAAGAFHTCALNEYGTVACWGRNNAGQSPAILEAPNIVQIAAGHSHNCAIIKDGTVVCWGDDSKGQCTVPADLSNVIQVAAGTAHTCALTLDGAVTCWGDNNDGQCAVPSGLSGVVQVTAGAAHTCILHKFGTLKCWGSKRYGELTVPTGLSNVVQVVARGSRNCVVSNVCTAASCGVGRYCSGSGTCANCNIGDGRCTACISATQCTACEAGWKGATCQQQACKVVDTIGCTTTGSTACCPGQGLTCVIPSGSTTGTCMKPPTLSAAPVKGVSAVIANKVVTATIQLADYLVLGYNGGAITHYWTALVLAGKTSPLYTVETAPAPAVVLQEGTTVLLSGDKLPPGGLCGRTFRVMFAARNGAGYSAVATSAAIYTMPACPGSSLQTTVTCWGGNLYGRCTVPISLSNTVQISARDWHTCAVNSYGAVACWGYDKDSRCTVPNGLSGVIQVEVGNWHTCALRQDGTVACWGDDGVGQCTVPSGLSRVVQIAVGSAHTCSLNEYGSVECWGSNYKSQSTVPDGLRLANVVHIAAGDSHNCALLNDGTVICWGDDSEDQCTVPSGLSGVVQISAGVYHTCALRSNSAIVCWGLNNYGQCAVPSGLSDVVQISAGGYHSCALKSDGFLVCWGTNWSGERSVPSGVSGVVQVSAANSYTCAIWNNACTAATCGVGRYCSAGGSCTNCNTISDGRCTACASATQCTACQPGWQGATCQQEAPCTATSCGTGRYCSVGGRCTNCNTIGNARCTACASATQCTACQPGWQGATCQQKPCPTVGVSGCTTTGDSSCCAGQGLTCVIPSGSTSGTCMKPPTLAAAPVKGVSAVIAYKVLTATVQLAAAPVASNNGGAITHYWTALIVPGSTSPLYTMQTAAGSAIFFQEGYTALLSGGKLPAYGLCGRTFKVQFAARNGAGYSAVTTSAASYTMPDCQTTVTCWGDNSEGQSAVPAGLSGVAAIEAGGYHTCALKKNGVVTCWGRNSYGECTVPAGLPAVVQVAVGWFHTCAVTVDDTVACWGYDGNGQSTVPFDLSGVDQIAAGAYHNCALLTDGTVACWGDDTFRQTAVPPGLSGVIQIVVGDLHNCALIIDGTVVCWGWDDYGQTSAPSTLPWVSTLAAGQAYTCAVMMSNRAVVCWGDDTYGGSTVPSGMSAVFRVWAGRDHTCALQYGGTIICWGDNRSGQRTVPPGLSNVLWIATGGDHTCALSLG